MGNETEFDNCKQLHDVGNARRGGRRHNFASYVWLAYSVFFFFDPVLRRSLSFWIGSLAIYAIFLILYIAYVEYDTRTVRLWLIAAMCVLGWSTIAYNDGSATFIIFTSALLPFCVESVPVFATIVFAEAAGFCVEGWYLHHNSLSFSLTAFFLIVVGSSNMYMAQQKRADARLNAAREENAALAAVAERERIARDLHDVLGHTLSVIVLKAELAGRLMGNDDARAKAEIKDVERTARTALAEVREAIGGYRTRGLTAEIEQARRTLEVAGVHLICESQPPALRANDETVLSLAVREAVTNIVRHAHATRCTMQFTTTGDGYNLLVVEDDGKSASDQEGNGLRGMRERVNALGGRFRVERQQGTRLVIELPTLRAGEPA